MNLAVKFYKDVANKPEGMPGTWPAEVIELGASELLPDASFTLMTKEEYDAYRVDHWTEYADWEVSQTPPVQVEE